LPGWFRRVPLFGRLTLAPPSELHPRRAGHFLFSSLRRGVLALSPLSPPRPLPVAVAPHTFGERAIGAMRRARRRASSGIVERVTPRCPDDASRRPPGSSLARRGASCSGRESSTFALLDDEDTAMMLYLLFCEIMENGTAARSLIF